MRIGVFGNQWWAPACAASGHERIGLPQAVESPADKHHADLAARTAAGARSLEILRTKPADFLLDDAGCGLQFVPAESDAQERSHLAGNEAPQFHARSSGASTRLRPLHELLGLPLVSHFIDPTPTALQAITPVQRYQLLQSRSWVKCVFDKAHVYELNGFGVPNVVHLPIAAWDRRYDTRPLDPAQFATAISFVGSQVGTYFYPERQQNARSQVPGLIALAARATKPDAVFYDIYHDLYAFAERPRQGEPVEQRVAKMETYFAAKLFYYAALWIAQRDRFVLFLKRALPDAFQLIGKNWDKAYGLSTSPALSCYDDFLASFRRSLININLVSGNAETGVNMRTFEITAAGGFMLHQMRPELPECFEIGKECDAFRDEEELLAKCRYYLSNPRRAAEIAQAGQRRTLERHLFSHRLKSVLPLVERVKAGLNGRSVESSRFVPSPALAQMNELPATAGCRQQGGASTGAEL